MKRHNGQKDHKCDSCVKSFSKAEHLKRHIHGQKDHKYDLRNHIKSVERKISSYKSAPILQDEQIQNEIMNEELTEDMFLHCKTVVNSTSTENVNENTFKMDTNMKMHISRDFQEDWDTVWDTLDLNPKKCQVF